MARRGVNLHEGGEDHQRARVRVVVGVVDDDVLRVDDIHRSVEVVCLGG